MNEDKKPHVVTIENGEQRQYVIVGDVSRTAITADMADGTRVLFARIDGCVVSSTRPVAKGWHIVAEDVTRLNASNTAAAAQPQPHWSVVTMMANGRPDEAAKVVGIGRDHIVVVDKRDNLLRFGRDGIYIGVPHDVQHGLGLHIARAAVDRIYDAVNNGQARLDAIADHTVKVDATDVVRKAIAAMEQQVREAVVAGSP